MKDSIAQLNPVFESRLRLAIMSVLAVNDSMDFNALKEFLEATDGNLATHIATLERNRYVAVRKKFIGRKPRTTYEATAAGKKAFEQHLGALEELIREMRS